MASSCRGYSKAQMCFFKILHIISSTPPSEEPFPTRGIGIDLNLRFCSESSRSDDNNEEALPEKSLENNNEVVNHAETESQEAASFGRRDSNCLDLLIEAARVVSGKDDALHGGGVAEREPVVRSKRRRNQALPYRFRDSVVQPLKRATRSHKPSSTANLSKRLLRSSPTT